jgi:hypothetical protein
VLQAALQAAWAEILVETASSFHGLDSPSKAALIFYNNKVYCSLACFFTLICSLTFSCGGRMLGEYFVVPIPMLRKWHWPQFKVVVTEQT